MWVRGRVWLGLWVYRNPECKFGFRIVERNGEKKKTRKKVSKHNRVEWEIYYSESSTGPGRPAHNAQPVTCSGEPISPTELKQKELQRQERKRRKQEERNRKLAEKRKNSQQSLTISPSLSHSSTIDRCNLVMKMQDSGNMFAIRSSETTSYLSSRFAGPELLLPFHSDKITELNQIKNPFEPLNNRHKSYNINDILNSNVEEVIHEHSDSEDLCEGPCVK